MKFCEVSWNSISNRCWKFQLPILKNKKVLFLKKYFLSHTAKKDPKDGVSRPNFQWRFWFCPYTKLCWVSQDLIKGLPKVCMDLWLAHLNRAKNNLVQTKKRMNSGEDSFCWYISFSIFPQIYLVIPKMYCIYIDCKFLCNLL